MNAKNLIHGRATATISKFSPQSFEKYFRLIRQSNAGGSLVSAYGLNGVPQMVNFGFSERLGYLATKDHFISYVNKIQVLEVLPYHRCSGAMYWNISRDHHTFPAGVNLLSSGGPNGFLRI